MSTVIKHIIAIVLLSMVVTSCSNEQSLQEYYVANQESNDFILVDVPTSLIKSDTEGLTEEQQRVLQSVRKVNMMAYPIKEGTQATYETEKVKVGTILSSDDYKELMSFGNTEEKLRLYFKGEEDAIDELIVFANDDNRGFLVARVLGDDMNIGDMMKLAEAMKNNSDTLDLSKFEGIMDVFKKDDY